MTIKELIRFAIIFILRNPNFLLGDLQEKNIFQSMGELDWSQ
jgi:hypothetical protein